MKNPLLIHLNLQPILFLVVILVDTQQLEVMLVVLMQNSLINSVRNLFLELITLLFQAVDWEWSIVEDNNTTRRNWITVTVVPTTKSVSLVPLDTLAMQDPLIIQAKVAAAHQTVLSNNVDTWIDLVYESQRSDLVCACTGRFT